MLSRADIEKLVYRVAPSFIALCLFTEISALYVLGHNDIYFLTLRLYGMFPFKFPFVDIDGSLAAWECTRLGIDVVVHDPCDILGRSYNYSPLWMAGSFVPLGTSDRGAVGLSLDLLFICSLTLLPPAQRPWELALVLLATNSTMVVFAIERANPDIIIFLLSLGVGFLTLCPLPARLLGYVIALFAAMLKYYPLTLLILSFRERASVFLANSFVLATLISLFVVMYLPDMERGIPLIAVGSYHMDLFAAKNLPFQIASLFFGRSDSPPPTSLLFDMLAGSLYGVLFLVAAIICQRILATTAVRSTLFAMGGPAKNILIVGCALIVGCFFAGQSLSYRGIFLLFVLSGLLAMARNGAPPLRRLCVATAILLVLLMWGEFFRNGLVDITYIPGISTTVADITVALIWVLWLVRELAWWWVVSIMIVILLSFLAGTETISVVVQMARAHTARTRPS